MNQQSKTILVVEDDRALLNVLEVKLTAEGFLAISARDGKEGLDVALKVHPDLILLDIAMPVMDGISMLKFLRKDKWGVNVPVIILTNLNEPAKMSDALTLNTYQYLVKADTSLEDIVKQIKKKLDMV